MNKNNSVSFFQASFSKGFIAPELPIITVQQGDIHLNLIIDTGSDNNVIDSNIIDKLEYTDAKDTVPTHLTGVGGTYEVKACNLTFTCQNEKYSADFLINDFRDSFLRIFEAHAIQLHGMIGSKFLRDNNIVLDFQNLAAYSRPLPNK